MKRSFLSFTSLLLVGLLLLWPAQLHAVDILQNLGGLSSVMYFEALRALGLLELSDRKPAPPGPEPLLLNSVVEGTARASGDPNQDVEPAV